MRIVRWTAVLLFSVILLLVVTPGILGLFFQKKYNDFLTFVNSQGQVNVHMIKYHRGWFHSRAELQVTIVNPYLRHALAHLDLSQLEIKQTIQHGPIIYRMPPQFLLARVRNHLLLSPEAQQKLATMGISSRELTQYDDLFSFTGRDEKLVHIQRLNLFFPKLGTLAQAEDLQGRVAIRSASRNVFGKFFIKKIFIGDNKDSILFSDLFFSFNQTQNKNDLWLGKVNLTLPFLSWRDENNHIFSLTQIEMNGKSNEKQGAINGYRNLEVKEIQIDENKMGPLHINISIEHIDAQTLADMIYTYKKIISEGELYHSQLESKMVSFFPRLLNANSKFKINNFDLTTPRGNFQLRGELSLPESFSLQENHVPGILRAVNLDLRFRVSKMLTNDFIQFVTSMPLFYKAGPYEAPSLSDARKDLEARLQQNLVLIASLSESKALPMPLAQQLMDSQKKDAIKSGHYESLLKKAFLKKQMDRDTTYLLYASYSQILNQYQAYSSQLAIFQAALAKKFQEQVAEWVSSGYINEQNNDYLVAITRQQGSLKINGKEIE